MSGSALIASRRSLTLSTRTLSQPIEAAMAAWSNGSNPAATAFSPIPWSTQPSAPLLKTSTPMGSCSCTAVISAWIDIAKPPSPHTASTGRSGVASLAAIAAGTA
jgi:hypothetical protein